MSVSNDQSEQAGAERKIPGDNLQKFLVLLAHGLVLLAGGLCARAQQLWLGFESIGSPPANWQITADELDVSEELVVFSGRVQARSAGVIIEAERMEISRDGQRLVFSGKVALQEETARLEAQRLEFERKNSQVLIEQAEISVRREALAPGRLFLGGRRLIFRQGRYYLEGASFTTCDCRSGPPSWRVCAWRAEAEPDEGAWLSWPVLKVLEVPLLALPVVYFPLSERRSGFLFPRFNYSGRDGVVLSEAFFLTLGRSADTTMTLDWFQERGFRERLQLRARPGRLSSLQLNGSLLWDDRKMEALKPGLARRWALEGGGRATWQKFYLRWAVNLFSDSDYVRDFSSELSGRAADRSQTALRLEWAGQRWYWEADAAYLQDLRFGQVDLFEPAADGRNLAPADTIHRLGAWSGQILALAHAGWPLWLSARAQLVNFSSLSAAWRDWGPDGLPDAYEPRYRHEPSQDRSRDNAAGGEGDGELGDGELRRAVRLLLQPRLQLRIVRPELALEGWLEQRQLVYLPHGPGAPTASTRGTTLAGAELWTELVRHFETFNHRLRPALALAGAWETLRSSGPRPFFDLEDRPYADAAQLVAGLDNIFARREAGGWALGKMAGLKLRQGLDLRSGRPGQLTALSDLRLGWLNFGAYLGWDWKQAELAEIRVESGLKLSSLVEAWTGYIYLFSAPDQAGRPAAISERLHRQPGLYQGSDADWLFGVGDSLQALQLRVGLRPLENLRLFGEGMFEPQKPELGWVGGGLNYDSACRCWNIGLVLRYMRGQSLPDVFVSFQLTGVISASSYSAARF